MLRLFIPHKFRHLVLKREKPLHFLNENEGVSHASEREPANKKDEKASIHRDLIHKEPSRIAYSVMPIRA